MPRSKIRMPSKDVEKYEAIIARIPWIKEMRKALATPSEETKAFLREKRRGERKKKKKMA